MNTTPKSGRPLTTRRRFCSRLAVASGAAALWPRIGLFAQQASPPATSTRPDVAAIDHDRILAAAAHYLTVAPAPVTSLPSPRSPGVIHDYYSEPEPDPGADTRPDPAAANAPPPFVAQRDALFTLGLAVPALAAAHLLTGEERYAEHAVVHLRVWFIDPATSMTPSLNFSQVVPQLNSSPSLTSKPAARAGGRFQGLLETLPLVEVAVAIPFLAASASLSGTDLKALRAWFAAYLAWLTSPEDTGPRLAELARDNKDHHATSWLLQTCAYAALNAPAENAPGSADKTLADLRHRFRYVTLRAQITANGSFPHELGSPNPYRDSLFNLDMMAGVCHLLTNRFDNVWEYALEDGPSMRTAIAFHFPYIANRGTWPYRADTTHFAELPARRASLLLTAHPYQRPEYAALWKTLPPDPPTPEVLRTLPIHQPLLWVRQPPRA